MAYHPKYGHSSERLSSGRNRIRTSATSSSALARSKKKNSFSEDSLSSMDRSVKSASSSSSSSSSSFLRSITPTFPSMRRKPPPNPTNERCILVNSKEKDHISASMRDRPESPRSEKSSKVLCCDACDGKHETENCPYFKKKREKHRDAQKGKGPSIGGSGGNFVLKRARVVNQPGDGSCLFHSLAYGMGSGSARSLRRNICSFIASNPNLEIAETPLKDWVKWDSNCSVGSYASRMSVSGWGGGIEMAACSRMNKVNVHVYEADRRRGGYKRISCFDYRGARTTVHVLYRGGVHYDALVPC